MALKLQVIVSWPMRTLAGGSSATHCAAFAAHTFASMVPKAPRTLGSCSATELRPDSHYLLLCLCACLRVRVYVFVSVCPCESEYLCAHACVWMQVCVSEGACVEVRSEIAGRGSVHHVDSWIQMRWAGLVASTFTHWDILPASLLSF